MTHGLRFGCAALLMAVAVGCQGPVKKVEPTKPVKAWNPSATKGGGPGRSPGGANSPLIAPDAYPKGTGKPGDLGPAPVPSPPPPQPVTPETKLPSAGLAPSPPIETPPQPIPPPGGMPIGPPSASGPLLPPMTPK